MPLMLTALWEYRQFILSTVLREFQGRYRASLLGAFWSVAQPLTLIVIYTVIFGQLMQSGLPGHGQTPFAFSIYLCAGVVFWGFHAEITTRMASVFIEQASLMKKTAFPRACLPAIVTGSACINLLIIFLLYSLFLMLIDHWPGAVLLAVIPLLLLQTILSLGLGLLLGTVNVFFRYRAVCDCVAAVLVLANTDRLYRRDRAGTFSELALGESVPANYCWISDHFSRQVVARFLVVGNAGLDSTVLSHIGGVDIFTPRR